MTEITEATTNKHVGIIIEPIDNGKKFIAYLMSPYGHSTGKQLCISRDPWHEAARVLTITEGFDPNTFYTMRYQGQSYDAMRGMLGKAAGLMTVERDHTGISTEPYKEAPSASPEHAPSDSRLSSRIAVQGPQGTHPPETENAPVRARFTSDRYIPRSLAEDMD